jgi:hypothetical protein
VQVTGHNISRTAVDGDLDLTELTAISPLDGRYGRRVRKLRALFSEYGLIKHRVLVEVRALEINVLILT